MGAIFSGGTRERTHETTAAEEKEQTSNKERDKSKLWLKYTPFRKACYEGKTFYIFLLSDSTTEKSSRPVRSGSHMWPQRPAGSPHVDRDPRQVWTSCFYLSEVHVSRRRTVWVWTQHYAKYDSFSQLHTQHIKKNGTVYTTLTTWTSSLITTSSHFAHLTKHWPQSAAPRLKCEVVLTHSSRKSFRGQATHW